MAAKKIQQKFLSTVDMAEEMSVSTKTIVRYIQSGDLKAQRFGKQFRVEQTDWEQFKARKLTAAY